MGSFQNCPLLIPLIHKSTHRKWKSAVDPVLFLIMCRPNYTLGTFAFRITMDIIGCKITRPKCKFLQITITVDLADPKIPSDRENHRYICFPPTNHRNCEFHGWRGRVESVIFIKVGIFVRRDTWIFWIADMDWWFSAAPTGILQANCSTTTKF